MRKIVWAFAVALVLAMAGCSSTSTARTTDADSLVVFKTEFINPDRLPRGFEMKFHFSGDYPETWVGQYSWDFIAERIHEPGVVLQRVGFQVQAGFRATDVPPVTVNASMPYEAGQIVIADYVFVHEIHKTAENHQQSNIRFRRITQDEKDALMKEVSSDERFSSWMASPAPAGDAGSQ